MISKLSMISAFLSLVICIGLPIILIIYFYKKEKISLKAVLIGALVFIIVQPLIRIPIINYLQGNIWFVINIKSNIWTTSLFYALTAGIFEECGRFIAFKYIIKNKRQWKDAIAFGIGHGGIEAVYIAITMGPLTTFLNMVLINMGKFESIAAGKGISENIILGIKNSLVNTAPSIFLLPSIERIFAMTIQIALTMVVFYGIKNNKKRYLLYAILLHTIVDFPCVLIKNPILVECYIGLLAVISLVFLIKSKNFKRI